MAFINGTHGEYTRTDDFRLSDSQRSAIASVGITPASLVTINRGRWGVSSIYYPAFEQAWLVYVEEMIRAPPSIEIQEGRMHVYDNMVMSLDLAITNLPLVASSSSRPVVCCPDLGLVAAVDISDLSGLVDSENCFIYVHPADFVTALLMQASVAQPGPDDDIVRVERQPLRATRVPFRTLHGGRVAFLNGANGEWTNKDDVRRRVRARQRQQPRRPRRQRRRAPARQAGLRLSHCASRYARALADPFNPDAVGACVPVYPSPPSYKVTSHVRAFTVTIGTAGVGGAWFMPCIFRDRPTAYGTGPNFSQSDITMPASNPGAGTWNSAAFSTLPFDTGDSIEGRVVSMATRVTYTGTTLDLSGMFASFVEPDHNHVTATSLDSLAVLPYTRVENTKRRMNNLAPIFGVKPEETIYQFESWPLGNSASGDPWQAFRDYGFAGFVVTGVPGTTFNVEMIQHVEYIGRSAAAGLSPSHTDSRGFEMVQQAGSQLASYLASSARAAWPTMRSLLLDAAADVATTAGPTLLRGATRRTLRLEL